MMGEVDGMDAPELRQKPASRETDGVEAAAHEARETVWALLDEWKAGEPAAGFEAAVMARIRGEERAAPEGRLRSLVAWFRAMDTRRGFGLAAAMASIFLAFALLWEPSGTPGISGSVTAAREFSAQQAESALEDLRLLDELYGVPVVEEHQGKKI